MDRKEYLKKWRLENKEKIMEYSKQYYIENQEKIKEREKKYYLKNQEKFKEFSRQYFLENKETIKEKKKIWNQNHQIWFLGKSIYLDNIERTFSCICCRFQGKTNFHHLKYDLNDPLKYTVELCDTCHVLWHMEENYLRFGKKDILPSKELMIENTMDLDELEENIGGELA